MGAELTLGAEEEFHLVDLRSWRLAPRAPEVLDRLGDDVHFEAELQRTTVESNSAVVETLPAFRAELARLRAELVAAAADAGAGVATVGTAPRSELHDFELTDTGRFALMQQRYRALVDEQLICGFQVHVGVSDRDLAVAIAQRIECELPLLVALSASSPFWNGADTGYDSYRSLLWQRWPSAGAAGAVADAAAYDTLLADLVASGVIADLKMAYFEVRPSAHAPTLELRVSDGCPLVDDAVLVAGLFRAMVRTAELAIEAGEPFEPQAAPLHRAAMWQAARAGLDGPLLDHTAHPRPLRAADAVGRLVARLTPALMELGDLEEVTALANRALIRGNSASRQRAVFAERGDLDDVMRAVVSETHGGGVGA